MTESIQARVLDPDSAGWPDEIRQLRSRLGAPNNPLLFPTHFIQTVLPKIGGHVMVFEQNGQLVAAGFLFPRDRAGQTKFYTLRLHRIEWPGTLEPEALVQTVRHQLGDIGVVTYDPQTEHAYEAGEELFGDISIGRPSANEATAIPGLYGQIWGSAEGERYPADIHSTEFCLGASLVARSQGELVGFLFGFYKFGGSALPAGWAERFRGEFRLESQVLGVMPDHRGRRIGYLLKAVQARQARRQGIGIVNWTADPLQYPNAVLNFGRLRAVAFDFFPDHYAYRNKLNRVPTARLGLTWLVGTRRVEQALAHPDHPPLSGLEPEAVRWVNQGWQEIDLKASDQRIAVEIPADWTALQRDHYAQALRWREATNQIFHHYIGHSEGRYIITGVGAAEGRRCLIAERANVDRLGELTTCRENSDRRPPTAESFSSIMGGPAHED